MTDISSLPRTRWTKKEGSAQCIHCGLTWDMHIADGVWSCPETRPTPPTSKQMTVGEWSEMEGGYPVRDGQRHVATFFDLNEAHAYADSRPVETEAEWQPIATAPRSGIAVLLWQPWKSGRNCTVIGHYANGWVDRDCEEFVPEPTYWMPLPAPPQKAADEPKQCGHLRSEVLAEKQKDDEPLFQMHRCLDCKLIFRVRSSLKQGGES